MLLLNRNEAKIVLASYRFDSHAPVSATLRDGHGGRVMGLRLRPVAGGRISGEQAVDQDPRTAPRVSAHHQTVAVCARRRNGVVCQEPLETAIAPSEDNPLQATVTANELHAGCQKWSVIVVGFRIQ